MEEFSLTIATGHYDWFIQQCSKSNQSEKSFSKIPCIDYFLGIPMYKNSFQEEVIILWSNGSPVFAIRKDGEEMKIVRYRTDELPTV